MKSFYSIALGILLFSCSENKPVEQEEMTITEIVNSLPSNHGVVQEIIPTSGYTYLRIRTEEEEIWVAVVKTPFEKGEDIYYIDALEMIDFKSRELDRVFEKVYFIQNFSKTPIQSIPEPQVSESTTKTNAQHKEESISIEHSEGVITIADLYKSKNDFNQKIVMVSGKVVKVNLGIMGKNWIHLQDGTDHEGNFDMLVTSQQEANIGNIVTFEGTLLMDQEFGGMYKYDVLIDDGKLK